VLHIPLAFAIHVYILDHMFDLAEQAERWVEVAGKDLSAASDAELYAAEKA